MFFLKIEKFTHLEIEYAILRSKELHDLCSSSSKIRIIKSRMRWAGHVARMGKKRNGYRLVGKPEGKRLLRRPKRRWVDNIRLDLVEVGWGDVDWITSGSVKCWESIECPNNWGPLE
jgi:hypothetical protein